MITNGGLGLIFNGEISTLFYRSEKHILSVILTPDRNVFQIQQKNSQ